MKLTRRRFNQALPVAGADLFFQSSLMSTGDISRLYSSATYRRSMPTVIWKPEQ